ncbi:MAG: Mfa1 fimbrilin C-terminal domain-containing protein [Muribaculaceae bacterium]|nr:Mfa1 fimbrilin C-terminal domain-containing protein [Muribaculaceae bacterium]
MKKNLFLIPCLAAALWSCSDKDVVGGDNSDFTNSKDVDYSYLAVNIIPNVTNTRDDDTTVPTPGDFQDGAGVENDVNTIRFYFFDYEMNAAVVKGNGATYYDAQKDEIEQVKNEFNDHQENGEHGPIESVVNAIIVIESPKGDSKPAYMAAVLNHNGKAPVLTEGESYTKLQEYVRDYYDITSFTMSSTVYKGDQPTYTPVGGESKDLNKNEKDVAGAEIVLQPVYDYIKEDRLTAIENPAPIYVERVLAKVSVGVNMQPAGSIDDIYDTGVEIENGVKDGQDNKIYVKFLGWNVTAARRNSRLVKDIDNVNWENRFSNAWNEAWSDPYNYRSYWAIDPDNSKIYPSTVSPDFEKAIPGEDFHNNWEFGSFGYGSKLNSTEDARKTGRYAVEKDFNDNNYAYLQENAGLYSAGTAEELMTSKIIVAAQLCDINGNPLPVVKWQENIYTLESAKDKIANDTYLYKRVNEEGETVWKRLTGEDIRFKYIAVTDETIADSDEAYGGITEKEPYGPARYHVIIELVDENGPYAIYVPNGDTGYELDKGTDGNGYKADYKDVKTALENVGNIMYWNNGYAYYWVDIRHLGQTEGKTGYNGVVRNHWYQYTFNKLAGLGVPVADPDQIIYPEKPKDDPNLFFLAADIKILSWRLVKQQNEQLGWGTPAGGNGGSQNQQ